MQAGACRRAIAGRGDDICADSGGMAACRRRHGMIDSRRRAIVGDTLDVVAEAAPIGDMRGAPASARLLSTGANGGDADWSKAATKLVGGGIQRGEDLPLVLREGR